MISNAFALQRVVISFGLLYIIYCAHANILNIYTLFRVKNNINIKKLKNDLRTFWLLNNVEIIYRGPVWKKKLCILRKYHIIVFCTWEKKMERKFAIRERWQLFKRLNRGVRRGFHGSSHYKTAATERLKFFFSYSQYLPNIFLIRIYVSSFFPLWIHWAIYAF